MKQRVASKAAPWIIWIRKKPKPGNSVQSQPSDRGISLRLPTGAPSDIQARSEQTTSISIVMAHAVPRKSKRNESARENTNPHNINPPIKWIHRPASAVHALCLTRSICVGPIATPARDGLTGWPFGAKPSPWAQVSTTLSSNIRE